MKKIGKKRGNHFYGINSDSGITFYSSGSNLKSQKRKLDGRNPSDDILFKAKGLLMKRVLQKMEEEGYHRF